MDRLFDKYRRLFVTILVMLSLALTSCGGGGSAAAAPLGDGSNDGETTAEQAPELLPDFAVGEVVVSSATEGLSINVSATITNAGEAPAPIPGGWVLVSTDPDFTDNYHYLPVQLFPQGPGDPGTLAPGQSATYKATNNILGLGVRFQMSEPQTTHYVRLWLNPDLSARFLNPEPRVVESHEVAETDYDNNLSPSAFFEWVNGVPKCQPDLYEDNDSIAQATPIALDTRYDFNGCDDLFNVLSITMTAGQTYEFITYRLDSSFTWALTVISPDGTYVTRDTSLKGALVTASATGVHHVALIKRSPDLMEPLSIEIVSR